MAGAGSVYAKAVFELTGGGDQAGAVVAQLREVQEALRAHSGLRAVLTQPTTDASKRRAILKDLLAGLGISGLTSRLLEMLATRGRLGQVGEVIDSLEGCIEASQGILAGRVRSAVELSAEELNVLGAAISRKVGSRVRLSQQVDPSLLGGVVATVGGRTFDASLRTQIERFRNELI